MSFRFQNFPIYWDIRKFIKKIYLLSDTFPNNEKYELSSQLRRAAVSILLNIAEGSAKRSDKEFNRYINISIGSIAEIVAILDILSELSLIDSKIHVEYTSYCESLVRRLYGFSRTLKK